LNVNDTNEGDIVHEKRIHERKECSLDFNCQTYFTPDGIQEYFKESVLFEVLNISQGGLFVRSEVFLKLDSILWYTFYLEKIPYVVLSRVRWVKKENDRYLYGLEFLSTSNMLYRHLKHFVASDNFFDMFKKK